VIVLDASAVLALIFGEPGSDRVMAVVRSATISTVNFCEVLGKLQRLGAPADEADRRARQAQFAIADFDTGLAQRAAALLVPGERFGLSLGDRACLALAMQHDAMLLTSDRNMQSAGLWPKVELIR
jgi:PIN domain nuclease of toxin-antitoxin system